jgi:hypothetical protein
VAQRIDIILVDDLDESELGVKTRTFSLDGKTYEIDLSEQNGAELREALAKYMAAGRRVSTKGRSSKTSASPASTTAVREWARANGFSIKDRGRVPAEIQQAYDAAHPRQLSLAG